jgi:hypothetical protein
MVARIKSGKSLKGAVNYNEKKVKEGKAVLIAANSYPKQTDQLNIHDKINRLQKLADLNARVSTNCMHLSLNFDTSENLSEETLKKIATTYMEKIGFGKQPFLVYRHYDAAHQHIHIVTTNIQRDGKRISLHNIGRTKSETAREEIEIKFGLVKAGEKQTSDGPALKAVNLEKVQYGKSQTKRSITSIVNVVVNQYKFASLVELNAILRQFNVEANPGEKGTRMFANKGLLYHVIDNKGNKMGVPIKASSMAGKLTLKSIESKFEISKVEREKVKQSIKEKIDKVILKSLSQITFKEHLKAINIDILYRTNDKNFVFGTTYIDHDTKTVFNGSDLGKKYSAAAIREKWPDNLQTETAKKPGTVVYKGKAATAPGTIDNQGKASAPDRQPPYIYNSPKINAVTKTIKMELLEIVMGAEQRFDYVPYQLKKKRRRKRYKL